MTALERRCDTRRGVPGRRTYLMTPRRCGRGFNSHRLHHPFLCIINDLRILCPGLLVERVANVPDVGCDSFWSHSPRVCCVAGFRPPLQSTQKKRPRGIQRGRSLLAAGYQRHRKIKALLLCDRELARLQIVNPCDDLEGSILYCLCQHR